MSNAEAAHGGEHAVRHNSIGTPQPTAQGPRPLEPGLDPLGNPGPLELGNRSQNMHLEPPSGRRGVDPLGERYEGHAESLELVQQAYEVLQVPSKPVEPSSESSLTIQGLSWLAIAPPTLDPRLTLTWTDPQGDSQQNAFDLVRTAPHFGGVRWWFSYRCGRRVGILYLPPSGPPSFGCRTCHGLTYRSSQTHNGRLAAVLKTPEATLRLLEQPSPREVARGCPHREPHRTTDAPERENRTK